VQRRRQRCRDQGLQGERGGVLVLGTAKALVAGAALAFAAASLPLKTVATVPLPGGPSRLDYASVDSGRHRLYIAHLGGGLVIVFDTKKRRVVKTIPAPGAHGVLAVPSLGRVYASATDAHELLTIDERTNTVTARAPAGDYPDGIAYDAADRRVYVSDESGGAEIVFSAAGHRLASVPLGGEAGNVQYDPVSGRMLADVQTRDEVAVISTKTNRVIRRVALPGCDHDHGLLVDAPRRLAFVACDGNARLLTLDLGRMKVIGTASIGASPDVLAFDTSLRRLYVSAESGNVAVFAERGRALYKLGQAFLAPDAHVVAVNSTTHLVYFPLQTGPRLLIMKPTR
jgi:DNA-binding beta-propeller fold protein YncE